ncbi:protein-L-isoaspartate O-methyltransferase [Phreatobacter aquaticus]|uniref:Protein-L-isoaspartate O-methyltransferase n=1 Tax=Phreatobacter aquaticus TaxID=2570229 RepID=A0A4D7QJK1_9HYPH|nr:protein-L-isoaspartate O-methyltransferase [Phreatobacter aquaticus]QCK87265.1 protein-L-isoaspartate O-methyltransferase [Phreatobacter aquaticus]
MIDYARARRTMVDTQIRVNDVTDHRIVDALSSVPRETFVPEGRRDLAYIDDDVMVSDGTGTPRYILEPMALAKMLQAAAIEPGESVLDVGTATGYSAAVLSQFAARVVALEEDGALAGLARQNLAGLTNVELIEGPLAAGAQAMAPFNVILLQGAVEIVPSALTSQLAEGGRLVAVVGKGRSAKCLVHSRLGSEISVRQVFDAAIPALPGFAATREFIF